MNTDIVKIDPTLDIPTMTITLPLPSDFIENKGTVTLQSDGKILLINYLSPYAHLPQEKYRIIRE